MQSTRLVRMRQVLAFRRMNCVNRDGISRAYLRFQNVGHCFGGGSGTLTSSPSPMVMVRQYLSRASQSSGPSQSAKA